MKKTSSILASICLMSSLGVNANENQSHWYIGGTIGQATYDISKSDLDLSDSNIDDSDTALKILAGYQINPYFSVEAGYADLGELKITNVEEGTWAGGGELVDYINSSAEVTGFIVNVVGKYPLSDKVNAYAKLGMFSWDSDSKYDRSFDYFGDRPEDFARSFPEEHDTASESGTDVFYGVGLSYDFEHFSIIGEYELFSGDGDDIDVLSIGAVYRF